MIFKFGEQLLPVEMGEWEADQVPAVFLTDSKQADEVLGTAVYIDEKEIEV